MVDKVKVLLFLHSFAAWLLVLAESACNETIAEECKTTYHRQVVMSAEDINKLRLLCGSNTVNEEAYACLNSALPERECEELSDNYRSQLALIKRVYVQTCAQLETIQSGQQNCQSKFVSTCASDLLQAMGQKRTGLAQIYAMLIPQSGQAHNNTEQQQACNRIRDIDFHAIKNCIVRNGCGEGNAIDSMNDIPGIPKITFIDVVNIIEGICKPGCEQFPLKYGRAKRCMQDDEEPERSRQKPPDNCEKVDEHFSCLRREIGSCATLRSFLEKSLTLDNISSDLKEQCPDVNLSLDPEAQHGDSDTTRHGLIVYLAPILTLTSFLFLNQA